MSRCDVINHNNIIYYAGTYEVNYDYSLNTKNKIIQIKANKKYHYMLLVNHS